MDHHSGTESVAKDRIIDLTLEEILLRLGPDADLGLFPTLSEVLKQVSTDIGILVEMKYPQLNTDGTMEHHQSCSTGRSNFALTRKYMEKNEYVDKILNIIMEQMSAKPRNIAILTFDADIALMVNLKQDRFPVFIVTRGRLFTDGSQNHADNRVSTFGGASAWALFSGLHGMTSRFCESLQEDYLACRQRHLVSFVYGDIPRSREFYTSARDLGLDGLILDDIEEIHRGKMLL